MSGGGAYGSASDALIAAVAVKAGLSPTRVAQMTLRGAEAPRRTICLYLTAASQLCAVEALGENGQCSDDSCNTSCAGIQARANLFRWLTFGRTVLGWEISMPQRSAGKARLPRTVRDLSVLMRKIEHVGIEQGPLQLLQRAIAKAFGFTVRRLAASEWRVISRGEEIHLSDAHDSVRVPGPLRRLVETWATRATPAGSGGESTRTD